MGIWSSTNKKKKVNFSIFFNVQYEIEQNYENMTLQIQLHLKLSLIYLDNFLGWYFSFHRFLCSL